jgi:hypothetical protein
MLADDPFLNIHKDLTREVISWLCDSQRKSNVYVIAEPPTPKIYASGGSRQRNYYTWANSRASVFATICSGAHRFGDEQARHWDTISTLAAGLAAYYPPFRLILTKKLVDNPGILDLPARTRFKKLVHEPWKVLRESHPHYIATPPVVVLRCNFEEIEEVFHSFCESGLSPRSSPLLWIISIDTDFIPPPLDPLDSFQYIRLPVRYNDGPSDTALILHHRFSTLRQKYEKMFDRDEVWPSEEQMSHLIRLFSGVFESIDAVINFVDSRDGGGPRVHLETFLTYMADSPSPSDERPYCALDHFYTAAYSNIPFDLLSISQDVLSIMHFAYYGPITSLQLACLLSIKEITILRVFTCLSRWAMFRVGEIYETLELFRCFREDPTRSGHFHNSRSDIFALQAFQLFLGHSFNLIEILNPRVQSTQVNAKAYSELDMVRCWATNFFYPQGTASNSSRPDSEYFLTRHFDFRCLAYACDQIYPISFCFFLRELHAVSGLIERKDHSMGISQAPVLVGQNQLTQYRSHRACMFLGQAID